jgi:hypothetical protein
MVKDEETEIVVEYSVRVFVFSFDVGRSSFNISFKTMPYGINATCEHLKNNYGDQGRGNLLGFLRSHQLYKSYLLCNIPNHYSRISWNEG